MWNSTTAILNLTAMLLLAGPIPARACGNYLDLSALATEATSSDPQTARRAIQQLRQAGPRGLAALMQAHAAAIEEHRADPAQCTDRWRRIATAVDTVAAQKDAWASGLYWYTDLEQAKRIAQSQNKPILYLRLLGTLDTEFSCANSRFFRTVLYANNDVRKYLAGNFILHWQSHRPVPRLTIDFGDGRVIERTITGNSAHYVLTPTGRVVDVLPGLYGPSPFLWNLDAAKGVARLHDSTTFESALFSHHKRRLDVIRNQWARDLAQVRPDGGKSIGIDLRQPPPPTAAEAARRAVAKSAVELRPVLAIAPERRVLESATDDQTWQAIAALHAEESRLDQGSRAVVASKGVPDALAANRLTVEKRQVEDPLLRMIRNLERSVAEDSVRNEYLLHAQVHAWFAEGKIPVVLDDLNEKVYAELFLMPKSDPWLGLVPPDAYTALPREATVNPTAR